jgi:hypothetical protein
MARTQTNSDKPDDAYGASTIQVACKLPGNGVILRLHQWHEENVIGMGGISRSVRVARPILTNQVHVRGYRGHYHGPTGEPQFPIIGGYAITTVPRDFWEEWLKQNVENPIVKTRLIWAHQEAESVRDFAREHEEVKNGREPIDPDAPNKILNGKSAAQAEKSPDAKSRLAISPDDGD